MWIDFDTEAGLAKGYLARPARGSGPGVLVLHAWWGLTAAFTSVADRLAAEGFMAFAPDLYQGRTAQTIPEAEALMNNRDTDRMAAAARAAVGYLQAQPGLAGPRLGAVGFSMGSAWMGLLTQWYPAALKAAVMFYGAMDADYTQARAAYQGHFAENDPYEDEKWVRAMEDGMRAAGREATLYFYPGAGHWFFEANRPDAYNPAVAKLAWERTLAFLREHLSGQAPSVTSSPG
ncbi:MAG: dienelactone hydrolase family protein [Anaerolineales bacterium]|nr:dienelactone hydrolase family protein [Anaerolineales bacterium]